LATPKDSRRQDGPSVPPADAACSRATPEATIPQPAAGDWEGAVSLDDHMEPLVYHLAVVSTGIMLLIAATHDPDLW
jgi:hypothetical protein